MLRRSLIRPRFTSYAALSAALVLFLAWGAPPPFAVIFRFGNEVIGPAPALDLVLPNIGGGAGLTSTLAPDGSPKRSMDVWVTLADTAAVARLAVLARATSAGHPVTGTCEILVTARDTAARAGMPRRYTIEGCFAKSVDGVGTPRRVTLGYTKISVSE